MSTTIEYKGSTLTTVSNETKTLETAGTWLEDDITITDVSGGSEAISVVDTLDSHGGTVRTITALDISDTTAVASDVASGKYFYTASGIKTEGSASIGDEYTHGALYTGDYMTAYPKVKTLRYSWDLTQSLTDTIAGKTIVLYNSAVQDSNGITLSTADDYAILSGVYYRPFFTYEFDISTMSWSGGTAHGRLIMFTDTEGLIYRTGSSWQGYINGSWEGGASTTSSSYFSGTTVKITTGDYGTAPKFYVNDTLWRSFSRNQSKNSGTAIRLGSAQKQAYFNVTFTGIRVYWGGSDF